MLREEFYKTVDEEGAAFLPQEFLGSKVQVGVVEKTSGNYMGASILLPDSIISPVVNLDSIYEKIRDLDMPSAMYKVGQVFEQVLTGMDRELNNIVSPDKIGEMFENYDMLKENLFVACASQSARFSKNKVPMEMRGDIRLVVKLNVSNKTFGSETITITKSQMKHLGISGERLFEDAFANMKEKMGVRFQSLGEVLGMLNLPPEEKLDRVLYVLSSERGTLGASMLYAPGVMEDISQKMQGDYYALPSSVHEWLILKDDGNASTAELEEIVRSVNDTVLEPEDLLSNTVYHYDSKLGVLEAAKDFDRRKELVQSEPVKEKSATESLDETEHEPDLSWHM